MTMTYWEDFGQSLSINFSLHHLYQPTYSHCGVCVAALSVTHSRVSGGVKWEGKLIDIRGLIVTMTYWEDFGQSLSINFSLHHLYQPSWEGKLIDNRGRIITMK